MIARLTASALWRLEHAERISAYCTTVQIT